jgi:hypothetical protein
MERTRRVRRAVAALAALSGTLTLTGGVAASGAATVSGVVPSTPSPAASCALGNGVQHVVELGFDNVHFFRDNPDVPSDLELMPHLLQFFEQNGTFLSNNHTPLIAHTGDDLLTTATGLYGDRSGMPISNSYQAYNADGTTDLASTFAYWTDPVFDKASTPNPGHDTHPSLVYSPTPPASTSPTPTPNRVTPAPWVPFTRAGCDVGEVGTVNQDLENTSVDLPKVFGPNSPEVAQLKADPDSFKDPETADYVGIAVHCAAGNAFCSSAQGVKFGQSAPSPTAVSDVVKDEPGGYVGFQALLGHRYVAPELGAGTSNLSQDGIPVTNAAGNLTDLNGNQLNGAFTDNPGFPGFSEINASQTLAYMADMLESGVPVVNGYIADIHGNEDINDPAVQSACTGAPDALGSGSACYIAQAQYYDQAFAKFFQRLAADGITPANTLFMLSSDEGDHEAGANVGRAITPTPSTCDGAVVTGTTITPGVPCTYPAGSFGELGGNVTGLLATEKNDTTPFSLENDTAPEFYVTGDPSSTAPQVRTLEHDVNTITASNPYSGNPKERIANYLADPTEEGILHMVNADPARTPTFSLFAKPDYFLFNGAPSCSSPCVTQTTDFAWDHGDYAPEIDTNYLGLAGPGVAKLGLDGSGPAAGPSSAGARSGQGTIPNEGTTGTWVDETDIRPTLMYLTGLRDPYVSDGRVISEVLTQPNTALSAPGMTQMGACYKQLNSSVGVFGTATLQADTKAIGSTSSGDVTYTGTVKDLSRLERARDSLGQQMKIQLGIAEFDNRTISHVDIAGETQLCTFLLGQARQLTS